MGAAHVEVVTWSLEMTGPASLVPVPAPDDAPLLLAARHPAPELSRFFYTLVGAGWGWTDRLGWTPQQWTGWVDRPGHRLVTAWHEGVPAGYFELDADSDGGVPGSVEVAYFGLAPTAIGRGWGGWFLHSALTAAWALPGTRRVWLHTCSLDHPRALANYERSGLVRFAEARHTRPGPTG
ncbi:GNAT family N-acetyltransferase [Kineosporia sp. A_224]|uniref:GNAT family N-acetyltransferase n=1 Tax=Kineosporia sp. A_224 TaxID=1962180 RepID=UPI000B4B0913|nr:GNAT family N-acetyltransferase [Kineosporia sp. A_224]